MKKTKKFIQKVVNKKGFRKGALRKKMGVKGKNKISMTMLDKKITMMKKKKKMTSDELRTMREMVFARNMMKTNKK